MDFSRHQHIQPACLPDIPAHDYDQALGVVAGWGLTGSGLSSTVSHSLQTAGVSILSKDDCRAVFHGSFTQHMLCIRGTGSSIGTTCPGDSGGGILYQTGDRYEVVGIVSWDIGVAGCQDHRPTVGLRVTSVLGWVKGETLDSNYCTG